MRHRSTVLALFTTLAAATAVGFLGLALDPDVYAPGARTLARHLPVAAAHHRQAQPESPPSAKRELFARVALRKFYSVVAFAIVGFFAAPLLRRSTRLWADAAVVGALSLLIEIAQKLEGSQEGYASNLFDIGCGLVGGLLGAIAWNVIVRPKTDRAIEG